MRNAKFELNIYIRYSTIACSDPLILTYYDVLVKFHGDETDHIYCYEPKNIIG